MQLAFREFGEAGQPPLVILHGLLGSSRNWMAAGKDLGRDFYVFALDLPNHGQSPGVERLTYPQMAAEVRAFMEQRGLASVHLLGHSLGGKVAMRLAVDQPEVLQSLTVVDISPRAYGFHFKRDFEAMQGLDLTALRSRRDADHALAESVPDWAHRQFLLTNLIRGEDGQFQWMIDIQVLIDSMQEIRSNALKQGEQYHGPTLFLAGGNSKYIRPGDHPAIEQHFPQAEIITLPESGHNPHIEQRIAFVDAVRCHALKV